MDGQHVHAVWKHQVLAVAVCKSLLSAAVAAAGLETPAVPEWRGQAAGTAWQGPDVLWRPREWLVFHLLDEKGGGFKLDFTLRDMNVYMQGARPALILVIDPQGEVCARQMVEDDGVISGNLHYCDGIYDPFQDLRYREYHRLMSPGGMPPGKERSPLLDKPETVASRHVTLTVPLESGPGLYRAVVIASWDHWVSITPDRPLPMGVHPGQGPLYAHKNRLQEAYLYLPQGVKDVGFGLTEEVLPFGWSLTVSDEGGAVLGKTTPRTRYSYYLYKNAKPDSVLRLSLSGQFPGCCLSVEGAPFVLCPDAETARKLHGGVEVRAPGVWLYHASQKKLLDWALSLKPEDLKVEAQGPEKPFLLAPDHGPAFATSADLPRLLAAQDLDTGSPTYGRFKDTGDGEFDKKFNVHISIGKSGCVAQALLQDEPDNGYRRNPALMRRLMLNAIMSDLLRLGPSLFFTHLEQPKTYESVREDVFLGFLPYRSGWYNFFDASGGVVLGRCQDLFEPAGIPPDVVAAWKNLLRLWGYGRSMAHSGEAHNQWALHMMELASVCKIVKDPVLEELLQRNVLRWSTPGVLGRIDPDPNPFCTKSELGFGYAADMGWTKAGYPSDTGFDAEYCNETVHYCRWLYDATRQPAIMERCGEYARLKAHLALPLDGTIRGAAVCPTDMSHRTPFPSAWPPIHAEMKGMPYVDTFEYWGKMQSRKPDDPIPPASSLPLPCLEEGSFVRNFDNSFYFLKTPAYYAIVYGGEVSAEWRGFAGTVRTQDGSCEFLGSRNECGYGARGRLACKLAGISSLFVKECGPVLLSNNEDVFYVNNLWTRRKEPDRQMPNGLVIPEYDAAGYVTPWMQFDEKTRIVSSSARFQYVPLLWNRTVAFHDDRVEVIVDITAMDDVDLLNLCEAIPYPAVKEWTVRTFRQDWSEGQKVELLPPRKAPPRHRQPGEKIESVPLDDMQTVPLRALDISASSGAGAVFLFEKEIPFLFTPPMTYNVQSFSLPLTATMKKGERQSIRYVIVPHEKPLASDAVEKLAWNMEGTR